MGSQLVSWFNKKQILIVLSTVEVEYVVVASYCTQLIWMMQTLKYIQITCTPPIFILCDNTSAIIISKNPIMQSRTKHIPFKYHFLQEKCLNKSLNWSIFPPRNMLLIYSLNCFPERHLNISYISWE